MDLDVDLVRLSADVSKKRGLEADLKALEECLSTLRVQEAESVQTVQKEEANARKLEGPSVSRLLYSVARKLEEKLDRELREAREADSRLNLIRQRIGQLEQDKAQLSKSIQDLDGCERLFTDVFSRKEAVILASDPEGATGIHQLDEAMKTLEATMQEIDEAVKTGLEAKKQAETVRRHLVYANRWANLDMSKYEQLEHAKRETDRLQSILDRFHTQLTDTHIHCDAIVRVSSFLYKADLLGFGDSEVRRRIWDAQDKLSATEREISYEFERLERLRGGTEEKN